MAGGTGDVDVGEEVHFDFVDAVALAGFAAAALDVEGEAARLIAAEFGFGLSGEEVADGGENAGVGCRVRARGAADGALVDDNDFVKVANAFDAVVKSGDGLSMVQPCLEFFSEDFVDEGGLAGAGDARDDGHDAKWELDREVFEVVFASTDDSEELVFFEFSTGFGRVDFKLAF